MQMVRARTWRYFGFCFYFACCVIGRDFFVSFWFLCNEAEAFLIELALCATMPRDCHEVHCELEKALGDDAAVSWESMGDKARKQLGWGIRQHPAATTAPRKSSRIIVR